MSFVAHIAQYRVERGGLFPLSLEVVGADAVAPQRSGVVQNLVEGDSVVGPRGGLSSILRKVQAR